jgi:hypothetical protein
MVIADIHCGEKRVGLKPKHAVRGAYRRIKSDGLRSAR